jgi:hypothetical protein
VTVRPLSCTEMNYFSTLGIFWSIALESSAHSF